ncbi:NUDIX domain-containing protein [Streptomyces sp. SP18CS02]|uniref:NUDIX domain-containing protein n=1 Tax=Streptomyces sp. SP18CS02 TaxID=3002531 RepID=UPI002E784019|nr:NUDIX domain-containing protein [Streptomyces sp. SP18CS02]MEE1754582.1 NUDIX domain-containing protein [Streptomyces sp. SP18CS02]
MIQERPEAHVVPEVEPGRHCVGVGVGALVFDGDGRVFMARRGAEARNEPGTWEFPGGGVDFGERLEDAIRREYREEYGIGIAVTGFLGVFDHILPAERQHWVSVTYLARHTEGVPEIHEPRKCTAIGWFDPGALPEPLSQISRENAARFRAADFRGAHGR